MLALFLNEASKVEVRGSIKGYFSFVGCPGERGPLRRSLQRDHRQGLSAEPVRWPGRCFQALRGCLGQASLPSGGGAAPLSAKGEACSSLKLSGSAQASAPASLMDPSAKRQACPLIRFIGVCFEATAAVSNVLEKHLPNGDLSQTRQPRPYLETPKPKSSAEKKVAQPMSKKILAAEQRMEKELQKLGLDQNVIREIKQKSEEAKAEKAKKKIEKEEEKKKKQQEKEEKALKKEQEKHEKALQKEKLLKEKAEKAAGAKPDAALDGEPQEAVEQKPKKQRKPPNGPMTEAMAEFVAGRKARGVGYIRAMSEWRQSAEREAIVSKMSESERKRRRYDAVEKKGEVEKKDGGKENPDGLHGDAVEQNTAE